MSDGIKSSIVRILTQARDEMRANMEARNINASGRTSASLRVEEYEGGVRLVGGNTSTHGIDTPTGTITQRDTAPIPTLEVGREGGNVPRGFYYIIKQWTREKGLQFSTESERGTFAYFLARKIAREGTRRHAMPVDVYSTPVMNAKDALNELISSTMSNTVAAAVRGIKTTNLRGAFTD